MKRFILPLLLFPITLSGQSVRTKFFKQDIAVHHTLKQGMSDEKVISVMLDNNVPVAIREKSTLKWDG